MTPERLDELKKLTSEATEGPWRCDVVCSTVALGSIGYNDKVIIGRRDFTVGFQDVITGDVEYFSGGARLVNPTHKPIPTPGPDAQFIAASRMAMAELIAEVEYLKRTLKSMEHPSHEAYWRNEVQRG